MTFDDFDDGKFKLVNIDTIKIYEILMDKFIKSILFNIL